VVGSQRPPGRDSLTPGALPIATTFSLSFYGDTVNIWFMAAIARPVGSLPLAKAPGKQNAVIVGPHAVDFYRTSAAAKKLLHAP
jgi:hypothetical protein